MPTKKQTELSEETAEIPGTMPPEGVEADVEVKTRYRTRVAPQTNESNGDSANDVLAEEAQRFTPGDPLSGFLEEWGNFTGYNCVIVRLPDPAARRMPGNTYARPCFEMERLGDTPFDPVNFQVTLQMLNNASGGVFRIWLTDEAGQMIPGARLDRFAIADPPRGSAGFTGGQSQQQQAAQSGASYAPPVPPREKELSVFEKQMQSLQQRLLENALERAINPPQPIAAPPTSPLTEEERLAMAVFNRGDVLSTVIQKIASAVQSPENVPAPTWKDKAFDYLMQNPAVGNQIAGVAERVTNALVNLFAPKGASAPAAPPVKDYVDMPPEPTAPPQATAAYGPMPPEVPIDQDDPMTDEEENMAILDDVINLLSGSKPMTPADPVFAQLQKEYPRKFPLFVRMIASAPLDNICNFIAGQGPLYARLVNGGDGAHYKARIAELKALCIAATTPPPAQPASATESATDEAAED